MPPLAPVTRTTAPLSEGMLMSFCWWMRAGQDSRARENFSVFHEGEDGGHVVGVDGRCVRREQAGQSLGLGAGEERVAGRAGLEAEDERRVEALVGRVVVGDVGGVPGLLRPGQERLGAKFGQNA